MKDRESNEGMNLLSGRIGSQKTKFDNIEEDHPYFTETQKVMYINTHKTPFKSNANHVAVK